MNRKRVVVAALVVACVATASISVYWAIFLQPPSFVFPGWSVIIKEVGWSISLARAEFNLTSPDHSESGDCTVLHYVEVNGMRVDAYPENLTLRDGEAVQLKVYSSYGYNQTCTFLFCDTLGNAYRFVGRSPLY